jgi:ATP-binding cassette, subfamily B, bacterial
VPHPEGSASDRESRASTWSHGECPSPSGLRVETEIGERNGDTSPMDSASSGDHPRRGPRRSAGSYLRRRADKSGRLMALQLLLRESKAWFAALVVMVVAAAALPNLTLIAMGAVVGRVPLAVRDGLGSPAGHRLIAAVLVAGAFFVGALLLGPAQVCLSSAVKAQLTYRMQSRLMRAVSRPNGIAHLEDAKVLDRLALAQGTLMTYYPADAPVALGSIIGTRLSGLVACGVLASFRWWLGATVLLFWLGARSPLRKVIIDQVRSFGGNAEMMRRAFYFMELATSPPAAKEIRVYGLGSWIAEQFRTNWLVGMLASWKSLARLHRVVMVVGCGVLVLYFLATLEIGEAALHHDISLQVMTVMLLMLVLSIQVGSIFFTDIELEFMVSALPNLYELEDMMETAAGTIDGRLEATALPSQQVRFDDVCFSYPGSETPVLEHLNLALENGSSTAIVGLNGAGKTTLVKLLARLYDPTAGQITVDELNLTDLDPASWQRQVAVVFQDFNHYPFSAFENVALGAHEYRSDLPGVERAIDRAGASELVSGLPAGLETTLSRQYAGGVDLSGGQWQRLALARALFAVEHGARILVLDEPTSWLDARGEAEFFERFLEITAGITTLVISHRFSTVRRARHICVLDGGRIVEEGSHNQLLDAGGMYASMFRMQAARFVDDDFEDPQAP